MPTRLKPLKPESARLWRMMTTNDREALRHGLAIAEGLGGLIEGVLDGVEVSADGRLLPSSRFKRTSIEQAAVLDAILLHQLSMAQPGTPEAALRSSVRRLDLGLGVRVVPTIKGFDGLEELNLALKDCGPEDDLHQFGPLPKLRLLSVTASGAGSCLKSLAGLEAPALQEASLKGLGLTDISALSASPALEQVDLSENPELQHVDALQRSSSTLQSLRVQGCSALHSLAGLDGAAALELLDLKGCASLVSLSSLSKSARLLRLTLEGCASLESLEGLGLFLVPMSERDSLNGFQIVGCSSLRSLKGLPLLDSSFRKLEIEDATSLTDLSGIEAAGQLGQVSISGSPVQDLTPLAGLARTTTLWLDELSKLEDGRPLGNLPSVQTMHIDGCPDLRQLPKVWSTPLDELWIEKCPQIVALGVVPPSLLKLRVEECPGITTLDGVEQARALEELVCDKSLTDGSAVAGLPVVEVRWSLDYSGAGTRPHTNVVQAFGNVMPLRLDLGWVKGPDIRWLIELPGLVSLTLDEGCAKANGLVKTWYDKEMDVRTLQRRICRAYGLPLPAFLKPMRAAAKAAPGDRAVLEMIRSSDPVDVVQALEILRSCGDASLFDQVRDGTDPMLAYTGDSRAIGRIFRETKAGDRLLARWALTSVLAMAPEGAHQAIALRQRISEISLCFHPPWTGAWTNKKLDVDSAGLKGLPMPDLSGFTGLKKLTLEGLAIGDLSFLGSLPSLESLTLDNLPALVSLKGLAGAPHLESFDVSGCPSLRDVGDLRHLGDLGGTAFGAHLDLANLGPLVDLGFVVGLRSLSKIRLAVASNADLSAFQDAESISKVELVLDSWTVDLAPLRHVRELVCSPPWGSQLGNTGPVHRWRYSWPKIKQLDVRFGTHDFQDLQAPSLEEVSFEGKAESLEGLGAIRRLNSHLSEVQSIESLADSQLDYLNVGSFNGSLAVIKNIQSLRRLILPSTLTSQRFQQLKGCSQICQLDIYGFEGSLSFLAGWTALRNLDLPGSRALSDIEVLLTLPALQFVGLKDAQLKREGWPKQLQSRIRYRY